MPRRDFRVFAGELTAPLLCFYATAVLIGSSTPTLYVLNLNEHRRLETALRPKRPIEFSASSFCQLDTFYSVRSATIGSVAEALRAGR